jgi:hypothetical protein
MNRFWTTLYTRMFAVVLETSPGTGDRVVFALASHPFGGFFRDIFWPIDCIRINSKKIDAVRVVEPLKCAKSHSNSNCTLRSLDSE